MSNLISFSGTIEQRETLKNENYSYIWFKIRQSRTFKDKEYVTIIPARVKDSGWAQDRIKNGSNIQLIGRIQQEMDGGLYVVPTENLVIWGEEAPAPSIDELTKAMDKGAHTTGAFRPKNAGEARFKI